MDNRTLWSAFGLVFGIILIASFSIRHNSFYSGICGVIGCIAIVGGFIGLHWNKIQNGDPKVKRTVRLLLALCIVLVVLNIITFLLA